MTKAIICDKCGKIVPFINFGRKFNSYSKEEWHILIKASHKVDKHLPKNICPECVIEILQYNIEEIKNYFEKLNDSMINIKEKK